jgi:hypothetical protein
MDIDLIIKLVCAAGVLFGCFLLSSNFIDYSYILSKLFLRTRKNTNSANNNEFLEILDLWYKLQNKCETFKLLAASKKLDEVFLLLNEVDKSHD